MLFELVDVRDDFVVNKLARGLGDHAMFFGEIFRGKDFGGGAVLDQKRATLDYPLFSTTADIVLLVPLVSLY